MYKLGLMALGESTMEEWSTKGLDISKEAIAAAGQAFQDAFKKTLDRSGSSLAGSSFALNKHQIIIHTQDVPDWFVEDYANTLSLMDNKEMISAFQRGALFFTSSPSTAISAQLGSYSLTAKYV